MQRTGAEIRDAQDQDCRLDTALRPETRAAEIKRDADRAPDGIERRRSQVLGILILSGLMLLYACLRYCLKLS